MTKVTNKGSYLILTTDEDNLLLEVTVPSGAPIEIYNRDYQESLWLEKEDIPKLIKLLQEFQSKLSDLETT